MIVETPLQALTNYSVGWVLTNPALPIAVPPDINVSAIATYSYSYNWWSSRVTPIPPSPVVSSTKTAVGVTSGETPLYVIEPLLSMRLLAQSNPLTSISNSLTITLNLNCEFSVGSVVTISGLVSTQTTAAPIITGSSAIFDFISWDKASGTLKISVTGIADSFTNHTIQFWVQNPLVAQSSPAITVRASIPRSASHPPSVFFCFSSSKPQLFLSPHAPSLTEPLILNSGVRIPDGLSGALPSRVAPIAVQKSDKTAVGVKNGELPLFAIVPVFQIAATAQYMPLIGASNAITVTISPNSDIRPGSVVSLPSCSRRAHAAGHAVLLHRSEVGERYFVWCSDGRRAHFSLSSPDAQITLTHLKGTETPANATPAILVQKPEAEQSAAAAHAQLSTKATGGWDPASGTLTMDVIGDGLHSGDSHVFVFFVVNGAAVQGCPAPQVEGTVKSESAVYNFTSPLPAQVYTIPNETYFFYQVMVICPDTSYSNPHL